MFTQDIVDFLNQVGTGRHANRLESNSAVYNFITCPHVMMSPRLFDQAQRISIGDNQSGRVVTILKRNGERCYIFQVHNEVVTIELIETLVAAIESKGGICRVERSFLVIELPLGYLLDWQDTCLARIVIRADRFEDIGIE